MTREQVVDAAVALADEVGLPGVSIRGVAARLGVAPMTLYGHVSGVDELVDLVVGASIAGALARRPRTSGDGRTALVELGRGLRRMFLDHPAVLDAYRRRPVQDPAGVAVAAGVLEALLADGLDEEAAADAYASVYAFVVGFASLELRSADVDPAALAGHPTLEAMGDRLVHLFDPAVFDRGLTALVDALTAGRAA